MAETQPNKGSSINAVRKGLIIPGGLQRIPEDRDLAIRANLAKEYYQRHYPSVIYRRLTRPDLDQLIACDVDPIYYEDRSKTFQPAVQIHAQVNADPPQQLQKKFGLDEERDVVFIMCSFLMEEQDVLPFPGDLIDFDGHNYEVQAFHRRDYWFNTNIPFYVSIECNRYREERL
jgi:hypothetical protein